MGPNNASNEASQAEKKLESYHYRNETRSWNFEKLARLNDEQHTTLKGLKEHGCSEIDNRLKVRCLMHGCMLPKTNEGVRKGNFPTRVLKERRLSGLKKLRRWFWIK